MTSVDLVVDDGGGGVLNTRVPLPTDGLPEWWRCGECGEQWCDERWTDGICVRCGGDKAGTVGLFPVTVGRWEEVERWRCDGCGGRYTATPQGAFLIFPDRWHIEDGGSDGVCGNITPETFGAIVQVGKVTGPSHRADECIDCLDGWDPLPDSRFCHPDAAPDGFHTPVVWDQPLDVLIPCDRPAVWSERDPLCEGPPDVPAEWWVPAKEATA